MGQILIRNLDDEAIDARRRRAKAHGHSLEQELLIESAAAYSAREKLAIAEYAQSLTPIGAPSNSADLIREDRER